MRVVINWVVLALACTPSSVGSSFRLGLELDKGSDLPSTTRNYVGFPRPEHTEYAKFARWLAHSADWGTVSYISSDEEGVPPYPIADVISHSDGPDSKPTGRFLFYLTPMYEFVSNLKVDARVAYTVAEAQLLPFGCQTMDPENPKCGKMSVLGLLAEVPEDRREEAKQLVFSRHPEMAHWPDSHQWGLYELHIQEIRLFDWIGGQKQLTPDEYFAVDVFGAIE